MRRSNDEPECVTTFLLLLTFLLSTQTLICMGADVLNTSHTLIDGHTLISSGGAFELGFFSPGNSKYRYLGIWYRKITVFTVVWVANRDSPITNTSGTVLKLVSPGILVLQNSTNSIVWSSNMPSSTTPDAKLPIAQLFDNGNFVVKEENDDNPDNYLWQSFENPTDTLLAGMKLGYLRTGHENFLSSWISSDDPGTGAYTYHVDPAGYPQAILRKDTVEQYRTGPWNGQGYSGLPNLKANRFYTFDLVMNGNTTYYYYELLKDSVVTRFMINVSGVTQRWVWIDRTQGWQLYLTAPTDNCDAFNQCRAHASCDLLNSPICGCLEKFIPKIPEAWGRADWSNGCVRRTPLQCETDGFVKYSEVKLPDGRTSWYNRSMSLSECKEVCRRNCSCMAYSSLDVRNGGSGCLFWSGDLLDLKKMTGAGQVLFIRMAYSELALYDDIDTESENKKAKILLVSLTSVGGVIILVGSFVMCWICIGKRVGRWWHKIEENEKLEVPFFELHKLSKATNGFSLESKIGEGGFGIVFKGTLENGQEIAVKRLSMSTSIQGHDEFKNEVTCIARHQHKNLVKLLGYCIQGKERMLIYEYMPNKSLDMILFDEAQSERLNWPMRFSIIIGIARGLMYLHRDCQLKIIHRDLKVSNILLDADMNPKISDFGMARIFGGNMTQLTTNKVVGTYGYMSPEYTSEGLFSTMLDVFSFGVMVLEIISGKRNRRFTYRNRHQMLLGHAWILHRDGMSLEIVQSNIMESCSTSEVLRSIHVGLLCVQASPEDRPSMSAVVTMLENDTVLPPPKQPGFFVEVGDTLPVKDIATTTISLQASSRNEMSITNDLEPR